MKLFLLLLWIYKVASLQIPNSTFISFSAEHNSSFILYNNLFLKASMMKSSMILYPFPLTVNEVEYPKGGVFQIEKIDNFNRIETVSIPSIEVPNQAKAIYTGNVAILNEKFYTDFMPDVDRPLFSDRDFFLNYYTNYIGLYDKLHNYTEIKEGSPLLVEVNTDDIKNGALNYNISLLVLPDFVLTQIELVNSKLSDDVVSIIKEYISNGGNLIVTGKSGYLLETRFGLLNKGSYDTKHLLTSPKGYINLTECNAGDSQTDFLDNLICQRDSKVSSVMSAYPIFKNHSNTDVKILNFVDTSLNFTQEQFMVKTIGDDVLYKISKYPDIVEDYFPFTMLKKYGKGNVFIFNGNPTYVLDRVNLLNNIYLFATSRNIAMKIAIDNESGKAMPVGESTIEVKAMADVTNFYTEGITSLITYIFLPKYYMSFFTLDPHCEILSNEDSSFKDINYNKLSLRYDTYAKCSVSVSDNSYRLNITVSLDSNNVTNPNANQYNVLYVLGEIVDNGKPQIINNGEMVSVAVSRGARLSITRLTDTKISQIKGNVESNTHKEDLLISNDQNTKANDVKVINVIPLISPLIDGNDNSQLVTVAEFYKEYYQERNLNVEGDDYLDIKYLNGKNILLVPEWDIAVTAEKIVRSDLTYGAIETSDVLDIDNVNYTLTIDNVDTILKQTVYKSKTNSYFGKSTQKLFCYKKQKKFAFMRYDIKPSESIISVDSNANQFTKGTFTSENGLIGTQYENTLLSKYKNLYKELSADFSIEDYIVELNDNEITKASDIVDFVDKDEDIYSGHHSKYEDIKFTSGYQGKISITKVNDKSKGGKIDIKLPIKLITPFNEKYIYYTANNVVVYLTEYNDDTNTLSIYYRTNFASYKSSTIIFSILNTVDKTQSTLSASVVGYEMIYDINAVDTNFLKYTEQSLNQSMTLTKKNYFSLPSLTITTSKSSVNGNAYQSSVSSYNGYLQELLSHSPLYTSLESHHITDPGLQLSSSSYSLPLSLGTSSSSMILSHSQSRIEYDDIWERRWSSPIESTIVNVDSYSGGIGNSGKRGSLGLSVTYEMLLNNERVLDWATQDVIDLLLKVKISNNHMKYFEPTICKENEFIYEVTDNSVDRVYDDDYTNVTLHTSNENSHIAYGHTNKYDVCYKDNQCKLSGKSIDDYDNTIKNKLKLCSYENYAVCSNEIKSILNIGRKGETGTSPYNYSPYVESYYPEGYIDTSMWDMTIEQYDNTYISKGYKFHSDNSLPSYENDKSELDNILTIPLYDISRYSVKYNKDNTIDNIYNGWWSDNMQNNDNTIISGNSDNLLEWTSQTKQSNIYTCYFNSRRLNIDTSSNKYAYTKNIYDNYIIPVIPDQTEELQSTYTCDGSISYTASNISKFEGNTEGTNKGITNMYYSVAVRGGAKESMNILTKLTSKYMSEGMFTIFSGANFKYWNPNTKKGTYSTISTSPIYVEGKDNYISIDTSIFPTSVQAIYGEFFFLVTINDNGEDNREYTDNYYTNSYGYGDITTSIYVGGIDGSSCKIKEGDSSILKVSFVNNVGVDFDLMKTAMGFEYDSEEINTESELLKDYVHSVKYPSEINILTFNIPEEYKAYITITPSDFYKDTAPEYFDYLNVNPASIKDGMESSYYYSISISSDFPEEYKGKIFEIPITINKDQFSSFIDDDRNVTFPPIKIGVPNSDNKVYYTLAYASNICVNVTLSEPKKYNIQYGLSVVTEEDLTLIREGGKDYSFYAMQMHKIITKYQTSENYFRPIVNMTDRTLFFYNISGNYKTFPKKNPTGPDSGKIYLFIPFTLNLLAGKYYPLNNLTVSYDSWKGEKRYLTVPNPKYFAVTVTGLNLTIAIEYKVLSGDAEFYLTREETDSRVYIDDDNILVEANLILDNVGIAPMYGINFQCFISQRVKSLKVISVGEPFEAFVYYSGINPYVRIKNQNVYFFTGERLRIPFTFYINFNQSSLRNLDESNLELEIFDNIELSTQLESGDNGVIDFEKGLSIPIVNEKRKTVSATVTQYNNTDNTTLYFNITSVPNISPDSNYMYKYYRKIIINNVTAIDFDNITDIISQRTINDTVNFTQLNITLTNETTYTIRYLVEQYDIEKTYLSRIYSNYQNTYLVFEQKDEDDVKHLNMIVVGITGGLLILIGLSIAVYFLFCKKEEKKKKKDTSIEEVPVVILPSERRLSSNVDDKESINKAITVSGSEKEEIKPNFIRVGRRSGTTGKFIQRNNYQETDD